MSAFARFAPALRCARGESGQVGGFLPDAISWALPRAIVIRRLRLRAIARASSGSQRPHLKIDQKKGNQLMSSTHRVEIQNTGIYRKYRIQVYTGRIYRAKPNTECVFLCVSLVSNFDRWLPRKSLIFVHVLIIFRVHPI